MLKYLLDTNIVIYVIKNRPAAEVRRCAEAFGARYTCYLGHEPHLPGRSRVPAAVP